MGYSLYLAHADSYNDYISFRTWHSCGDYPWTYEYTTDNVTNVDDRRARALERIADALEKLSKR